MWRALGDGAGAAGVVQERGGAAQGRPVQVDPIKSMLKPPGTKHLKLRCDILLSTVAFKFNLRNYIKGVAERGPW
jgi:hypothetical protein